MISVHDWVAAHPYGDLALILAATCLGGCVDLTWTWWRRRK